MMTIRWETGHCDECGEDMKIPEVLIHDRHECKQCRLLAIFQRIAHALEIGVGDI